MAIKKIKIGGTEHELQTTIANVDGLETALDAVNEKLGFMTGKFSVKMYGAVGDGSTDDTAAFQAALAENRLVYVPEGTYILSDTLLIEENCELELAQSAVLEFTQTDANCVTLLRLASLRGNHATIIVPYTFSANVINADTRDDEANLDADDLTNSNATAVPPFNKWDPQWKMSRYVTDINICKPNGDGFHYSDDGTCYGTAVFMGCYEDGIADYMWGVNMSGVRIAGGFTYGIRLYCDGETWNHDMRVEAVLDACETAVSAENTNYARLAVTIQPRPAADGTKYAKNGIKLVDAKGVDLGSSRVWDWNATNSLWATGNEYQHIAMYGQCRGLILDDFLYHEDTNDIRSLIYTDTASNLEQMTISQEPITRWFKPVNGKPYFSNGYIEKRLTLKEELDAHFCTDFIKSFTDILATAVGTDGTIFNDIGYKIGARLDSGDGTTVTASEYYGYTGFVPCKKGSTIYASDLTFATGDGFCGVIFYDSSFNMVLNVGRANIITGTNYYVTYKETDNGFTMLLNNVSNLDNIAYARFTFYYTTFGENPMMALDEEIEYTVEGYLADNIFVKEKYVNGLGNKYEQIGRMTTSISVSSTDEQYPSAKAVYSALSGALGSYVDDVAALIGGNA